METVNYTGLYTDGMGLNITAPTIKGTIKSNEFDLMMILQILIASVGIVANFTVVFAFLNHKRLRKKIPNMFIINQVSVISLLIANSGR